MKKNTKLENMIYEAGQLIDMGKTEVKNALVSKKNVIVAGAIAIFALIIFDNIATLGNRYAGGSINDFIQMSKFL